MFGLTLTSIPVLLVIGALGALTLEHGWGWVLAKIKSYRTLAQNQATELAQEIQGQVAAAVDAKIKPIADGVAELRGFADRLVTIEKQVADLAKKSVGA